MITPWTRVVLATKAVHDNPEFLTQLREILLLCYYSSIALLVLIILCLSGNYHFQLRYLSLVLACVFILLEGTVYSWRSARYIRHLYLWFFWLAFIVILDIQWTLNPQDGWKASYSACVHLQEDGVKLYAMDRQDGNIASYLSFQWPSRGTVSNTTSTLDDDDVLIDINYYLAVDYVPTTEFAEERRNLSREIVQQMIAQQEHVFHLPLCGSHSRQGLMHQWVFFSEWLHNAIMVALIALSVQACIDYYWRGSSPYLYVYALVYIELVILLPKPAPPLPDESRMLLVSTLLYFAMIGATAFVISPVRFEKRPRDVEGNNDDGDDDNKKQRVALQHHMDNSRMIQTLWILFVWNWALLFVGTIVQLSVLYKIFKKLQRHATAAPLHVDAWNENAVPANTSK